MKKEKRILLFLMLTMIFFALPVTARAAESGSIPTRTTKLELSEKAGKNEEEGWEWKPDAEGGGTLTLTDCYIQSEEAEVLFFNNITEQGSTVIIVLKGENIIETTSQQYRRMVGANSVNGAERADIVIREEGKGSLEVRTSEPITTGSSPFGFLSKSLKVESGSIYSNVEICLLAGEFLMQGGSLVVRTPERIDNVFGIVSVAGPINIEGGTVDITAGHIGIITNGESGEGWSVNISGGDVRIKARQSCIQMQKRTGVTEHRVINITGGTFTGESDITGLYADDINIVKEGGEAPKVTINVLGDAGNPNIKAIHAIKELIISDSIVTADTIYNYDTSVKENSVVFQGENGQVYGEVTLDSSLTIPEEGTLNIPEGAVLNIPENVTINVPKGAVLVNDGILVLPENSGNISCSGTGFIKKGEEIYTNELARLYPVMVETTDGEVTKYYKEGDTVELTPQTAPEGKVFKEWKVIPDTVDITDNRFSMPAGAVTVSPVYEDITFRIGVSASPEGGGMVTGGGSVKKGDAVTVCAAANSGYIFVGWVEDDREVSTDTEYTFTASADRMLTAEFVPIYPVMVETTDGEVTKYYKEGDTVELTPQTAPEGKVFKEWKVTPDTVDITDNRFSMPAGAVTVSPVYEDITFRIGVSASPEGGGMVTGGGSVKKGDAVTVCATANSGYIFVGWVEDDREVSTDTEYTFTASADRMLTAEFVPIYPVVIETTDGEITKYYKEGDTVELTLQTAPVGKVFKEWKVTPDTVDITDNRFSMPAGAVTVSPVYEDIDDGKDETDREVSNVIALIDQIDNNVTLASEKAIEVVRKAYNELTAEQKALVINVDKLTNAISKLEQLKEVSKNDTTETNPGDTTGGATTPENPDTASGETGQEVKVNSIKITGISRKIAIGKKIKLTATVVPSDATNSSVTWSSSNTKYATVDKNGVAEMKKVGKNKTVTITAAATDGSGAKAVYKIKIMPKAVKKVTLKAPATTVKGGKKVKIKAEVTPSNKKQVNTALQWSSSNTKYATVNAKGVVTTKKAGKGKKVKITAKATDGSNKKKTITIKIK